MLGMKTLLCLGTYLCAFGYGIILEKTSLSLPAAHQFALPFSIRQTNLTCLMEAPSTAGRSYVRWRRYLKCALFKVESSRSAIPSPSPATPIDNNVCARMNGSPSKRKNVRIRRYIQCLWKHVMPAQASPVTCAHPPPSWSGKRALVRWRRFLLLAPNCPHSNQKNSAEEPDRLESRALIDLTGREYLRRLYYVYLHRSNKWIQGIRVGQKCERQGPRCSLGYYCKCMNSSSCTCQALKILDEIIVSDNLEEPGRFGREEGMSCNILLIAQCKIGLLCRKSYNNQYFCVKMISSRTVLLNYTEHQYKTSYMKSQNATENETIAIPDENSHIKGGEYDGRGLTVYVESLKWAMGLPKGSFCTQGGPRCSLGLSCKPDSGGNEVCVS